VSRRNSWMISGRSSPAKQQLVTDCKTSVRMRRTLGRDNPQEKALRSALFREGIRFRAHYRIAGVKRRSIDVALIGPRVAVFLDGCFWHGCPKHGTWPTRNATFWREKIEANRRRDRQTDALLRAAGWRVVRMWEHDNLKKSVARIRRTVAQSC
jgi:DNA mismatch endonuclease, patch repair protein